MIYQLREGVFKFIDHNVNRNDYFKNPNDTIETGTQTFSMNIECLMQQLEDKNKIFKKEMSLRLYISRTKYRLSYKKPCPHIFCITKNKNKPKKN